jgi:hypothetical protein
MNAYRERPNFIPWPPLLLMGFTLLAILLNLASPFPLEFAGSRTLGILLIAAALGIDLWAMRTLHEAKTTIMPHRGSSHLVANGPFGYSRNPIYLANMVLLAGMGFVSMNAWFRAAGAGGRRAHAPAGNQARRAASSGTVRIPVRRLLPQGPALDLSISREVSKTRFAT